MSTSNRTPSLMVRLQVLAAVDYAPGQTIRARIRAVSQQQFVDPQTGQSHQFTWRTIETWRCLYNKHGVTSLNNKNTRWFPVLALYIPIDRLFGNSQNHLSLKLLINSLKQI